MAKPRGQSAALLYRFMPSACARHGALAWALAGSLLLHGVVLWLPADDLGKRSQSAKPVTSIAFQLQLLPLDQMMAPKTASWSIPAADVPPAEYEQALQWLGQSQLNMPALSAESAESEAILLNEPVFVPSDFSRAQVDLRLALDIDETGLVRQIRVLSGALPEDEYPPIFAKLGRLQFRPAMSQGRGIASTKMYEVHYAAGAVD